MRLYADLSCQFETKSEGSDVASFSGVASTSELDSHDDIIEAGAFEPIARKGNGDPDVLMLRDHDRAHVIGGWKTMMQQGQRLLVEGQLCLSVEKARETYALLKAGFLSGLSVGFRPAKEGVRVDVKNGRRFISKASLVECSIVALPANKGAHVVTVKSDLDDWLAECGLNDDEVRALTHGGVDALVDMRLKEADNKPHGDVTYADPGYQEDGVKRYPIDTEGHIRAAWNYIHQARNRAKYSRDELERIEGRIIAAWKRKIDSDGPPAYQERSDRRWPFVGMDDLDEEAKARESLSGLLAQIERKST